MQKLEQTIIDRIKKEGPVTFEKYMDMALYYPELGYYSSPDMPIGKEGDFYTSSHLHPIFGAMICRQLIEMWDAMEKTSLFYAVEMGAGAGYLCKDIFDYLEKSSDDHSVFKGSLRYVIVEPFHHFEKKQRKFLAEISEKILWIKSINELDAVTGCIFSNELLDAFPVHLIEMDDSLKEIYVSFDDNGFTEVKKDPSTADISEYLLEADAKLRSGYRTEVNLRAGEWIQDISRTLLNGFILTIDYGYTAKEYYDEERSKGTLLCYHMHKFSENPYQHPGQQDITAHVNFSSLKKWGEVLGLKTLGYCAQGTYLISSGIDEVITELYSDSPGYLNEISKIKGLIMPQGMGESHRVMIQYKGKGIPELRGFSMRNNSGSL